MRIGALIGALLHWPRRGLARSHRYCTRFNICAVPVGAGKPAKRPRKCQISSCPGNPAAGWPG
ncbi:hypothetical protein D0O09_13895 [Pseudomonas putida]|nr:hypothetical protein D0O09_13895 [Pseudomonas putida]